MVAVQTAYAVVPRSWVGETAVILASGPSLTPEDVAFCQGRARVIAIKDTVRLAPWADVLYSGDEIWWRHFGPALDFAGDRYALVVPGDASQERDALNGGAKLLKYVGSAGIESEPNALRSGFHSGYQAIQLALHFGVRRIVLLGYDMQPDASGQQHYFGAHPYHKKPAPFVHLPLYNAMIAPLKALGVVVVNASRATALTCFERLTIQEALA